MPTKPDYQLHLAIMLMILISMGVIYVTPVYRHTPSRRNVVSLDINLLNTTIDMYHDDLGEWPRTLKDLVVLPSHLPDPGKWDGPYFANGLPTDPWDNDYIYRVTADGYLVSSSGGDGIESTDDDMLVSR